VAGRARLTLDAPARGRPAALAPLVPLFGLDVLTAFTVGMVPPLLPLLATHWSLSPIAVGLVNTLYAIGRLGAAYPASRFRARHGTRAATFLGLAGLFVGSVACGLAPSFPLFLVARLLMGVGASIAFLAIFAELLDVAPASSRGRVSNAFEGMGIVSVAAGGLLAATVATAWGWRAVFVGAGLVLLGTAVAWPAMRPLAGRQPAAAWTAWRPDRMRALVPVFAACLALSTTWSGLWTIVPLLGAGRYGLPSTALAAALGAAHLAEVVGLAGISLVIDRVRREPVFLWGSVSVGIGGLIMAAGATTTLFVLGLVLVGGGFAVWMIPATVLADRAGTPLPPAYLAVYRIVMDAGMIAGPLLFGGLAEVGGDRVAVGAAGFVLASGAVALARRST